MIDGAEGNLQEVTDGIAVQKNAIVESGEMRLIPQEDETTTEPTLEVGGDQVWRFPGEMGRQYSFRDDTEITLELEPGEDRTVEFEIPLSTVKNAAVNVGREGTSPEYGVELTIGHRSVWSRSDDDPLLGPREILYRGQDIRTGSHIVQGSERYQLLGEADGRIQLFDSDTMELLGEYNVGTPRRVLMVPTDGDPAGLSLSADGELRGFVYHRDQGELEHEHITYLHDHRILLAAKLSGSEFQDVITVRNREILMYENLGDGEFEFQVIGELNNVPNHLSVHGSRVITACSQRPVVEIFNYENGDLNYVSNVTLDRPATRVFGMDYNGDGEMELLIQTRSNLMEVFTGENFDIVLDTISLGRALSDVTIGDLDGNGRDDVGLTYTHAGSERAFIYMNTHEGLQGSKEFFMNGGGWDIYFTDMEGDGDLDIFMVSRYYIFGVRNKLNWINERTGNVASGINEYLKEAVVEYDPWGNPIVAVPITVTSDYGEIITLSGLNVRYDYRPEVDITEALVEYVRSHQANETGWVIVPYMVEDGWASEYCVQYSQRAPLIRKHIPDDNHVPWDSHTPGVIDLSRYFYDPAGLDIAYTIEQTDPEELYAEVDGDHIDFYSHSQEPGEYTFRVRANNGLRSEYSRYFTVSVVPPEPEIHLPDRIKVRENIPYSLDLSPYVTGLEHFVDGYQINTTSQYIEVDGLSLELNYTSSGYTEPVTLTLYAGPYTVSTVFTVETVSFNAPFFDPIPPVNMEKNTVVQLDLSEYVDHPGDPGNLEYHKVRKTDTEVNVTLVNSILTITPPEGYHGTSVITVGVEDVTVDIYDEASFTLQVNDTIYPPEYEGGLEDAGVHQYDVWTVDLSRFFSHEYANRLRFRSNHDQVRIVNITWAVWAPEEVSGDIVGLVFTAYDWEYPQLEAVSDPIRLRFIPVNLPPEYTGGIHGKVVQPGDTWSIHLPDHFDDREDPGGMTYSCSHDEIHISDNWTASWTPTEGCQPLLNVIFTAHDARDTTLTATSDPINLLLPEKEGPFAYIVSITPDEPRENEYIHFVGRGDAVIGEASYLWMSSLEGELSDQREFNATLSPGTHTISLRVMDERGNWSEYDRRTLTVLEVEVEEVTVDAESLLQSSSVRLILLIFIIGLSLNYVGYELRLKGYRKTADAGIRLRDEPDEPDDEDPDDSPYEMTKLKPDDTTVMLARAKKLLDQGEPDKAKQDFLDVLERQPEDHRLVNKLLELYPEEPQVVRAKARLVDEAGSERLALEHYKKLYELDNSDTTYFNKLLDIDPNNASMVYDTADALYEAEDYRGALAIYTILLEQDRDDTTVMYDMAVTMHNMGEYRGALDYFDRVLEKEGDQVETHMGRGAACYELGDFNEAMESFNKVVELDGDNARAWYYKARIVARQENMALLKPFLKKALELEPDYRDELMDDQAFDDVRDESEFKDMLE